MVGSECPGAAGSEGPGAIGKLLFQVASNGSCSFPPQH